MLDLVAISDRAALLRSKQEHIADLQQAAATSGPNSKRPNTVAPEAALEVALAALDNLRRTAEEAELKCRRAFEEADAWEKTLYLERAAAASRHNQETCALFVNLDAAIGGLVCSHLPLVAHTVLQLTSKTGKEWSETALSEVGTLERSELEEAKRRGWSMDGCLRHIVSRRGGGGGGRNPLLKLEMPEGCNVTDVGISAVAQQCHQLQLLDASKCSGVTDVGISAVAQQCHQLQQLNVGCCNGVID
jgi:hypothetical protein